VSLGVTPLKIVDHNDHATALCEASQHFPQCAKSAHSDPGRIEVNQWPGVSWKELSEYREDFYKSREIPRQQPFNLFSWHSTEVYINVVDEVINRMIRNRLTLITAALEDYDT
jgi:hypothetical protein